MLALLTCLLCLPFCHKAFHIDDRIYLEVAGNILQKPFFPYDYPVLFEGLTSPDAASHSHLPLTSYCLAAIRLLAGHQAEWPFHLAFMAFALLAVLAFFDLARQLVRFPMAAAALLLISPGFFVLSHSLMADVPFLAFWLLALSRFLPICRGESRRRDWVLCGIGLFAAALTSLLTVGLVALMAACWLLHKRANSIQVAPTARRMAFLLLIPLLIWIFWYGRAYLHYDRFLLVNTVLHMGKRETLDVSLMGLKLASFVLNIGAAFLFPLAIWYGLARAWSGRIFGLLFFLALTPFSLWIEDWSWTQALLFAAFLATGALAVFAVLRATWGRESGIGYRVSGIGSRVSEDRLNAPDASPPPPASDSDSDSRHPTPDSRTSPSLLLPLWFFGVLAACLILFYAGSVRYTILAAPPLILIWINELQKRVGENPYLLRNLIWLGFFLTLPYSLWIAQADYRFADMYRQAAQDLVEEYSGPDRSVWFTAEWGLRHYLKRGGARPLPRTSAQPKVGDIILKPYVSFPWVTLYDSPEYSFFLRRHQLDMSGRLRILDFTSKAGFYSTGWGILPIGLRQANEWEWINVYQVKKKYDGPIPQQERHW